MSKGEEYEDNQSKSKNVIIYHLDSIGSVHYLG